MGRFADAHHRALSDARARRVRAAASKCPIRSSMPGSPARRRYRRTTTRRCSGGCATSICGRAARHETCIACQSPAELLKPGAPLTLAGVPDGAEGLVLADLARARGRARRRAGDQPAGRLPRRAAHGRAVARARRSSRPISRSLEFPAWDCLPYDRVSPHAGVVAQRMTALSRLAARQGPRQAARSCSPPSTPRSSACRRASVVAQPVALRSRPATCSAMDERHALARAQRLHARLDGARAGRLRGARRHRRSVPARAWTSRSGSISSATRWNRSAASIRRRSARPASCARSTSCRWRNSSSPPRRSAAVPHRLCRAPSARPRRDDPLYEAVSEGRRHPGMEHWLPLFHDRLETLFDYLPGVAGRARAAGRGRRARAARRRSRTTTRRASRRSTSAAAAALPAAAARPALSRRDRMAGAARRARRSRG